MSKEIEVNLNIASRSLGDSDSIRYIESLKSEDGRVEFSLIVQIKQTEEIEGKKLKLEVIRYSNEVVGGLEEDGESGIRQKLERLPLEEISLHNFQGREVCKKGLFRDKWKIRQNIRINLSDVPTKGAGEYVIVAYQKDDNDETILRINEVELLDCVYFEVVQGENQ